MSLTLGEKLRQAREERGFTLSEVAEQTRISSLYLESIENDDYKILPGGIFNKGFVKSFAKFVGVNEQEALADYTRLIAETEPGDPDDLKVYRPEVLTDDRSGTSMAPTIITALIILALMTAGILFALNYLRQPSDEPATSSRNTNINTAANIQAEAAPGTDTAPAPDISSAKMEFKATSEPVSLTAITDGSTSTNVVTPGTSAVFEPKERLKLSYSKSLANVVQLTINGKNIALPSQPLMPRRNAIEFEINKDNFARIWEAGAISPDTTAALPDANTSVNTAVPAATPMRPASTPAPRPRPAANTSNTAAQPNTAVRSVPTPRSTVIPIPPPTNRP